jgi:TolA-binding protein
MDAAQTISRGTARLLAQLGVPGVKDPFASPSEGAADTKLPNAGTRPAEQETAAKEVLEQLGAPKPSPQPDVHQQLAMKDAAIADLQRRLDVLQAGTQNTATKGDLDKLSAEVNKLMESRPKPEDLAKLSADEQVRALAGTVSSMSSLINQMKEQTEKERQELRAQIDSANSLLGTVRDEKERKEALEVQGIDWDVHRELIARKRAEVPKLSVREAAILVVNEQGLKPTTPAVVPATADRRFAVEDRRVPANRRPQEGPTREDYLRAAADLKLKGQRVAGDKVLEAMLRDHPALVKMREGAV